MTTRAAEPTGSDAGQQQGWWNHPATLAAAILVCALPLLWPDIPPLVDLPGHMGRYRVQMEIDTSPHLQQWYDFNWALIGNLGVDLLVVPLSKIFGLELAVKLIVMTIPPLTAAGFLWVAREVHGRIPPTAFFAVPLTYNFPFGYGFVNFALSMAFAFLAFALWLRLARTGRLQLRAMLFLLLSPIIWVTHTFGWGTLGVLAFSAELVRQRDGGRSPIEAFCQAALHCLAIAPPLLLMLAWRSGHVGGATGDWFSWPDKWNWLLMTFRDRWEYFDLAMLGSMLGLFYVTLRSPRMEFSRNMAASALFLLLVYLLLPGSVFGSAFADMRLAPFMIAVAIIGIRFRATAAPSYLRGFAIAALLCIVLRMGGTTLSYWLEDRSHDRELQAMRQIPHGARLISFVGSTCKLPWALPRLTHLPGMALVRKQAFSNEQWETAGAQLLTVRYPGAETWRSSPSETVLPQRCPGEPWRSASEALNNFPRAAFDYVWLIDVPPVDPKALSGLQPLWRKGASALYRVVDRTQPPPR